MRHGVRALALALALAASACGGQSDRLAASPLAELREDGATVKDPERVGRWLLAELLSPGGDAKRAAQARARLDELPGGGVYAHLGRGLSDAVHGKLRAAPQHYLNAVRSARTWNHPNAPLFAWFAAQQAMSLRGHAPDLFEGNTELVDAARNDPRHLGWRARGELLDWWIDEQWSSAKSDVDQLTAREFGCVERVELAGPFGGGAGADALRSFPAERPGPWPERWPAHPERLEPPRLLATERQGCAVRTDEAVEPGIFYAETYVDLAERRDVLVAVQGALGVWVDDRQVLDRDPRQWGVWPRFGVALRLEKGRHRLVAKLSEPATSVRMLDLAGRPLDLTASVQTGPGYHLLPPERLPDPNVLMRFIGDGDIVDPKDDLVRYVAAQLALVEGQADVASVLLEPLIEDPERATGPALLAAAAFTEGDPIFDATQTRDLVQELHDRAQRKDPRLWQARLSLAVWEAERNSPAEAVQHVRALVTEFPDVAAVRATLAHLYAELGWNVEYSEAVKRLAERFGDDAAALELAVKVYDAEGDAARADALVDRILKLDPDSEIRLQRALSRQDYATALRELQALGKRRPERKDLAERIEDLKVRAGDASKLMSRLEAAVENQPRDGQARLALADARYAKGNRAALGQALADAVQAGASADPIKTAIDLVEGATELEPYRVDGLRVIADYEAADRHMEGTAARVLDYAAIWVRSDGSSRMLEHEIIRIQSAEAIDRFAEHRRLEGLVHHMRVIKKDGRILEPEDVPGKPTVTFPHLEVGDYIETEHVISLGGDGRGKRYLSPQWFFREPNVAYARSEFVVVTPRGQPVAVETRGAAPAPTIEERPGVVVRRFRVDHSPAAPSEPSSAPPSEFLPSVRLGWGVTLQDRLRSMADAVSDLTPVDPRVVRIARRIVEPLPESARVERAKRLYRWVLSNVQEGEETDGRRVVVGKNGNRWRAFTTLCRALDIPFAYAMAKNKLAAPPPGPLSEALGMYTEPLLHLNGKGGGTWLTFSPPVPDNPGSSKHLPFGYIPAEVRGTEARLLTEALTPMQTPASGEYDGAQFSGTVDLKADGSARAEIVQTYHGKYAMQLRSGLSQLPESQVAGVIEARILGQSLRGARLVEHDFEHLDDLDRPLVLRMVAEVPHFAVREREQLVLTPPFTPRLTLLTRLPDRQTPLLIGSATRQIVELSVRLPEGAEVQSAVGRSSIKHGDHSVIIDDRLQDRVLRLKRAVDVTAGRVSPRDYSEFLRFTRQADDVLSRGLRISVGRGAR